MERVSGRGGPGGSGRSVVFLGGSITLLTFPTSYILLACIQGSPCHVLMMETR
jgi:hypothetical protein